MASLPARSVAVTTKLCGPRVEVGMGSPSTLPPAPNVQVSMPDPPTSSTHLKSDATTWFRSNEAADRGVAIEIVAYGPGIGMLKADSIVGNRVAEALKGGVAIVACENTMKGQKLSRADMLDNIRFVEAGVVELMQRQTQGHAYIRP